MQKTAAITYFGGITKLADKLGISRQAIHAWPESVPDRWAYKIHYLSDGQLTIEPPQQERAQ